jgi:hypothetical protein
MGMALVDKVDVFVNDDIGCEAVPGDNWGGPTETFFHFGCTESFSLS